MQTCEDFSKINVRSGKNKNQSITFIQKTLLEGGFKPTYPERSASWTRLNETYLPLESDALDHSTIPTTYYYCI